MLRSCVLYDLDRLWNAGIINLQVFHRNVFHASILPFIQFVLVLLIPNIDIVQNRIIQKPFH